MAKTKRYTQFYSLKNDKMSCRCSLYEFKEIVHTDFCIHAVFEITHILYIFDTIYRKRLPIKTLFGDINVALSNKIKVLIND